MCSPHTAHKSRFVGHGRRGPRPHMHHSGWGHHHRGWHGGPFPWVFFLIPMVFFFGFHPAFLFFVVVPVLMYKFGQHGRGWSRLDDQQHDEKPKRDGKAKRRYVETADGEYLEVIDDTATV